MSRRLFLAARVADATTAGWLPDHAVLTEGDRIVGVVPRADLPSDADQTHQIHDLGDVSLLPGFVETHVHMHFPSPLDYRDTARPEPVELNSFLKALAEEFRSSQGASHLGFDLMIETGKTLVVFDKSQLHQCLWKLLDNTIHHASVKRPPHAFLKMRKDESAGYCVITVEDNGPGIPASRIADIFEPFYTTRKEGSGLGLYVARQLCDANQAELTVDSQPGVGTAFHIRMALALQSGRARMASLDKVPEEEA